MNYQTRMALLAKRAKEHMEKPETLKLVPMTRDLSLPTSTLEWIKAHNEYAQNTKQH